MTPTASANLAKAHDLFKFTLFNYLKITNPEHISQNKVIVFAQYITKLEMVRYFCFLFFSF